MDVYAISSCSYEQEMEMDEENINRQHSDRLMKHEQGLEMTFIQDLLTSCLQAAVALVRDQGTSRATHRVTILLKLLDTSHEAGQRISLLPSLGFNPL